MPNIFVNTDNSNPTAKIYKAGKAGNSAAAVEKKMQDVVIAILGKAADFATNKSAAGKGYTIRIEITKVEKAGGTTTYTVHPAIVRFPPTTGKGGKGELMVSTVVKDPTVIVSGNSEALLLEGVADATEKIVTKTIPLMRLDMQNR